MRKESFPTEINLYVGFIASLCRTPGERGCVGQTPRERGYVGPKPREKIASRDITPLVELVKKF